MRAEICIGEEPMFLDYTRDMVTIDLFDSMRP